MPVTTLRDLVGRSYIGQIHAGALPPSKAANGRPMQQAKDGLPVAVANETGGTPTGNKSGATKGKVGIEQVPTDYQKPQMPEHELNVDHPTNMHSPEDAQAQFNFLKQAMGGPQQGFVTKNSKSHAVAHKLARSGHLTHVQELKQGNGHTIHHWMLTQKGVAAVGQTQNQAGRGGMGTRR